MFDLTWRKLLPLSVGLIYIALLIARLATNPEHRAKVAWTIRTWIVPPDADAGWEQD